MPWPPTCPTQPTGTLTALDVLEVYKDQWIVEQRHRDLKQTLHVRPVFLHNDDRIHALIAVIGIALLIYGLIEADLRAALGPRHPTTGPAARRTRRDPHRARPANRLHRPARHLHNRRRTRPRPAHPRPTTHPRPPQHPPPMARKHTAPQHDSQTQTITPNHAENGPRTSAANPCWARMRHAVATVVCRSLMRSRRPDSLDPHWWRKPTT